MKGVVRLRRLNQRPSSQNHVAQTRLSQTKCATNDNNSRPVVTTVVIRIVTTVESSQKSAFKFKIVQKTAFFLDPNRLPVNFEQFRGSGQKALEGSLD